MVWSVNNLLNSGNIFNWCWLIAMLDAVLKNAFTAFDKDKKGCLGLDMIGTILELLGHAQTQAELQTIIKEVDTDGKYDCISKYVQSTFSSTAVICGTYKYE